MSRNLKSVGLALSISTACAFSAFAQIANPGVQQSGAVTAGHGVTWGPGLGQIQDSGGVPAAAYTASALTGANDTNVTITLSGTPATALLQTVTATLGWAGTLAAARLNGNVVQSITNDTNVNGSISAQNLTFSWAGTLAVSRGGTGSGTAAGALINLFPSPTRAGDLAYWNGTNYVLLPGNNSGTQVLSENSSGLPAWTAAGTGTLTGCINGLDTSSSSCELTAARRTLPTTQTFLSGSGTYTTPSNVLWIEGELVGGGGGGSGNGTTPGTPTAGGNTCWNTTGAACTSPVYQAGGGGAGNGGSTTTPAGGAVSGSGTCLQAIAGGQTSSSASSAGVAGAAGGNSVKGGGGAGGGFTGVSTTNGTNAAANSGGGGGGAGGTASSRGEDGGSAGAYCRFIIGVPASTYTYAVGGAGTGATAGTGGNAGGNGAAGGIWIIEHYGT